ncbi:MAG: hypothetical protein ACJ780_05840 [Solirubrobacteraceae bacterium]
MVKPSNPGLIWGVTLLTAPGMKGGGSGLVHTLLSLGIVLSLLVIPLALYRRGSHPGASDADPGDGWRKPPEPPKPPSFRGPEGGLPLEKAVPARVRLRHGERLADLLPRRARRGGREPERKPAREPTKGG